MADSIFLSGANVVPDDDNDLAKIGTIFIGTSGDVRVTLINMADGTYLTYKNMSSGSILPGLVKRVWATGTTASDIIVNIDSNQT